MPSAETPNSWDPVETLLNLIHTCREPRVLKVVGEAGTQEVQGFYPWCRSLKQQDQTEGVRFTCTRRSAGGPRSHVCANVGSSFLAANTVNCSICYCFASSYWGFRSVKLLGNYNLQGFASRQAIVELYYARFCFAPSYCGITISRLLFCVKLLWNSNLRGFALHQAKVLFCPKLLRDYNLQGRLRFVIFLKHAKSILDCGSSYI